MVSIGGGPGALVRTRLGPASDAGVTSGLSAGAAFHGRWPEPSSLKASVGVSVGPGTPRRSAAWVTVRTA